MSFENIFVTVGTTQFDKLITAIIHDETIMVILVNVSDISLVPRVFHSIPKTSYFLYSVKYVFNLSYISFKVVSDFSRMFLFLLISVKLYQNFLSVFSM